MQHQYESLLKLYKELLVKCAQQQLEITHLENKMHTFKKETVEKYRKASERMVKQ